MTNLRAIEEITARDCDGMHYRQCEYRMSEAELASPFGDLEFYARVVGYVVSFHAVSGTLTISNDNGEECGPRMTWSEMTEEGFHEATVTFERVTD